MLAEKQLGVAKSKAMPGLSAGYLNQGQRDNPANLNLQFGIAIPLWWWQHSARIKSAKAGAEAAAYNEEAAKLEVHTAHLTRIAEAESALDNLNYYMQKAIPASEELAESSMRFFNAGETDYTEHLRLLNEVLTVKIQFAEAALQYASAKAELEYIQQ